MKARLLFILLATMSVALGQSTKNLNQFTELPEAPNAADWIYVWDSSANISKKISPANLFKAMPVAGLSTVGGVKRNVGGAGEFVSGIDASGNLVYGTPAGGGGGISITGYRVPYGNGSGSLTSEAGFEYDVLANKLSVTNVAVTDVRFGTDNITLSSPTPGVFYMTEGTLTGDELAFDLSSDNAIRIFSGTGVATIQYDGIDVIVPAEAYNEGTWNGSNEVPTKDAVRDKFESLTTAVPATLVPYGSGAGVLTTEAAFSYDSTFNILRVGSVLLGGDTAGWISYGASTLSLETASLEKFTFDLATANTMKFTTDSGINTVDFGSMGVKSAAAPTSTPTAMGALAVDLTKSLNTKTISSNTTITFSGVLADGQYSELRIQNTNTSAVTVSWAVDCFDGSTGELVSSFTVPPDTGGPNGRRHVVFSSDGTDMLIYQGGGTNGFPNPATEALNMGAFDITNAGTVTATEFVGSISGTSNVPAGELTGTTPDDLDFGKITTAKGMVYETTTIAATTGSSITVQTGVAENTITLNEATETVVFDAQPEAGKEFRIRVLVDVPDPDTICEVNFPSTYSYVTQGLRTLIKFPDNKPQLITVWHDGTSYKMSGDPQEVIELPEDTTPAITASVPIDQGAGTERTSLANIRDALGVTFNGTAATPNTDATVAVSFDRLSYYHHSGATQELDLPASAGYIGRGIAIRAGGSYTVTVDPNGTETIDLNGTATSAGEAVVLTMTVGQTAIFGCDSSGWFVSGGSATFAEETP